MAMPISEREVMPGPAQAHADGIAQVVRLLREEPEAALTVRQLAQLTYLSPYHFIRVFEQVTGLSPGDFRAALRLEAATRLLLMTTRDVTAICSAVGYQSLGTFTTRYTQLVGLSPGRLRSQASTLDIPRALPSCVTEQHRATVPGAMVRGTIGGSDVAPGPLFVGLFPAPIPQGPPVAGTLLHAPGPYTLAGVPDGCFYLVAVALPWSSTPLTYLIPGERLRIGRTGPLLVRHGCVQGGGDLVLHAPRPTDPPVVVALPALLSAQRRQSSPPRQS
jgi:AraC-like DNA-binding protein